MENIIFIIIISLILLILLVWSFIYLPKEKWQFIASVPIKKINAHEWKGLNLTYYGLFTALATVFSLVIYLVLATSINIPLSFIFFTVIFLLIVSIPSAKILASIIEKKKNTLSVGAAFFVGFLLIPILIIFSNIIIYSKSGIEIPLFPCLTTLVIAYNYGEGIGRLACISFGCCYGKPINSSNKIFNVFNFIFFGKTKKISYASNLDGKKVIPIQAITSLLYISIGIFSTWLFLHSHLKLAFILSSIVSLAWRFYSEIFRADHRGGRKISTYQIFSIISILFSIFILFFLYSGNPSKPDIFSGIKSLWNPTILLGIQGISIFIFFFSGTSMVTGSSIKFFVQNDQI